MSGSDDDWVCPECDGESGLPRASGRASTCTGRRCRDALRAKNLERRSNKSLLPDDVGGAATERLAIQSVKEIYGMGYCRRRDFTNYELRNGRVTYKHELVYLVRGKVGEDADDDRGSETRWVHLEQLVKNENINDDVLDAALDTFFDEAKRDAKQFLRELREERE